MESRGHPGERWEGGGAGPGPSSKCDQHGDLLVAAPLEAEQWNRQWLGRDRSGGVVDCVVGTAGLYGTAPTCYLSLVARVKGFTRSDLDRELYEERGLHRMRALRGSQFMVPVGLIDTVVAAHDRPRFYGQYVDKIIDSQEQKRLTKDVLDTMEDRLLTSREIKSELGLKGARAKALTFLIAMLGGQRRIATATVVGGWRSNQYRYALWEEWFPHAPPQDLDPAVARVDVALWYLGGHGPASVEDFQWWSGLNKTNARLALESSDAITVETEFGEMFDIPDRGEPPAADGLRLLPVWDTALISQKERRRMVAPDHHRFVYSPEGNVTSAIVLDGRVVGVWDRQGDDDHLLIRAAPLDGFDSSTWEAVATEAEVLATALDVKDLTFARADRAVDLQRATRNRFLSPLSGT